jgi:hypothetical protein
MNVGKKRVISCLLDEMKEIADRKDIQPHEKLRHLIRAQVKLLDDYPEAARDLYYEFYGLTKSEITGANENTIGFFNSCKQIIDEGVRAGVFRELDGWLTSRIVCDFFVFWGKSETIRNACKGSLENYENYIMDILTYGISKNHQPFNRLTS